jgi:hypothetical protein
LAQRGLVPLTIRNLLGLNRRDTAERVRDNQFRKLQNWYFYNKGTLYKRFGSTHDLQAADIPGANRVTGMYRYYAPNGEKFTLYHCEPDSTALPDPTDDLTLTEINGGDLFNGGAVAAMRFAYSWVGMGVEGSYNSKNRVGYDSSDDVSSGSNPGHQSITVSANTKGVRVTAPAFPSGIRAANIFAARGTSTQMTYVGTITSSGGTLDVTEYIGPYAARNDDFGTITVEQSAIPGSLKAGTYKVSLAWITDSDYPDNSTALPGPGVRVSDSETVVVTKDGSSIDVEHSLATSTNSATDCYILISAVNGSKIGPMVWCGNLKGTTSKRIASIPDNVNAQSHPDVNSADSNDPKFSVDCRSRSAAIDVRNGFIIKKNEDGTVSEVFPSRSLLRQHFSLSSDPVSGSTISSNDYWYFGYIRTSNDKWSGAQPEDWGRTIYPPEFTHFQGYVFFVNGVDIPWMTDGKSLGQIARVNGTTLPPYPRFISSFENGLIVAGAEAKNQIFGCNANNFQNWAVGGSGSAKRYMSVGDSFGDEVSGLGVWSLTEGANNDPRSYFVAFKRSGAWMKDTFPDPVSGVGAATEQLSGSDGCAANRSIAQTTLGLMYLGSDGVVRLIRGGGKPVPVGGSVAPFLEHLPKNDSLMRLCTASFHDGHYKLSYPSSSSSTTNDAELWADLRIEEGDSITWVGPHTGLSIGQQIVLIGEGDDKRRLFCRMDAAGTGRADDPSTFQDFGTDISSVLESKIFRVGAEAHLKRWLGLLFDATYDSAYAHALLLEMFSDANYAQKSWELSQGEAEWDASSWSYGDEFSDNLSQELAWMLSPEGPLVGRTLQFKFTHTGNAQFALSSFLVPYIPERRMII